ncbi:SusD/RagB family nutrient-binding outer membrane lipoprotein [Pedobacter mendelii]|uniref:SusD/RagB family nutrient-binding outer membrane lipoprotein n=1 Tax=Pedobacter mendelii TaxID=1908240 RepID=UPI0036130399
MKKIFINISLLFSLMLLFNSCKKQLDELYYNPERSTTTNLPGFFTAMLNSDRVRPAYWNQRTFLAPHPAVYSQTASFANASEAYRQIDGYIGNYWSDFYYPAGNGSGPLGVYRAMEVTYAGLPAAEQANQEVYMQAAKIFLYDQTSKMVDLFGDVPFTEAGSLETTSSIKDPKFDDAKALYATLIKGLDEAATYFGNAKLSAAVAPAFSKSDILLFGSLDKWRRYANSIRLRLLMRTSFVDETTARTAVLNMLNNSANYPLVDGNGVGNYSPASTDILLQPLTTNTNSLRSAITEINTYFAPDYALNKIMLPANDPRIPFVYDKFGQTVGSTFVPNKNYKAMPVTYTSNQQDTAFTKYSILDSATFINNIKVPGVLITASEVNFLKAEAYERWGSTSNALTAYNAGLAQSVSFYYYLHTIGSGTATAPAAADVATFVNTSASAYTGTSDEKLAKIWNQKWLNFGFLQSDQAWSEYRRTKYPKLTIVSQTLVGFELPPNRLTYPSIESANNSNYNSVRSKDTRTIKIFWDVK